MKTLSLYSNLFDRHTLFADLCQFNPVMNYYSSVELVNETPYFYQIDYAIPGLKRKDLKIKTTHNQLILEGCSRKSKVKLFKKNSKVSEYSLYKTFSLGKDMEIDQINAKFKNGILSITIPKKQQYIHYREIPVNGSHTKAEEGKALEDKPYRSLIKKVMNKLRSGFAKDV